RSDAAGCSGEAAAGERWALLVTPSTLLRRAPGLIVRRRADPRTRRNQGGLGEEGGALVVRLARRIVAGGSAGRGGCRTLGVRVSATSVRRILRRHQVGPGARGGTASHGCSLVRPRRNRCVAAGPRWITLCGRSGSRWQEACPQPAHTGPGNHR